MNHSSNNSNYYCVSMKARLMIGLQLVAVYTYVLILLMSAKCCALSVSNSRMIYKPKLPLPKPLLSTEPGTWAHDTMSRRIHSEILHRTIQENKDELNADSASPDFKAVYQRLQALKRELQNASTTPVQHLTPPSSTVLFHDYEDWHQILQDYVLNQDTWLSTPWMIAEFYFYRRLLQDFDYYNTESDTYQYDPFAKQKHQGLLSSIPVAKPILQQLQSIFDNVQVDIDDPNNHHHHHTQLKQGFQLAIAFALWGNKMDLSIWPANTSQDDTQAQRIFQTILDNANDNLLHDDSNSLTSYVLDHLLKVKQQQQQRPVVVDIIVDNAGFELIMDFVLADFLITSGIATQIRFQCKSHPTFVSDAMEKDILHHIEYYANYSTSADSDVTTTSTNPCQTAGQRWKSYITNQQWTCHEHSFWVQPPPMWEMPSSLRQDLATNCDLAFVKGDANYRRLLGDLQWDLSAPFQDVVGAYFPCPVCALRTLKAEVGCGMEKDLVQKARAADSNWMVNGRFGVVHFSLGLMDKK